MEAITTTKPAGSPAAPPSLNRSVTVNPQNAKRQRYDRCFSFMEIKIDPGIKSLKRLDSRKFKSEIQRWAKAVVRYARQVSNRFGANQVSEGSARG